MAWGFYGVVHFLLAGLKILPGKIRALDRGRRSRGLGWAGGCPLPQFWLKPGILRGVLPGHFLKQCLPQEPLAAKVDQFIDHVCLAMGWAKFVDDFAKDRPIHAEASKPFIVKGLQQ
jgi:hypothetical protein